MSLLDTKQGWLFSLSNQAESCWGSPESLLHELGLANLRNDEIVKKTTVYGKVLKTEPQPSAGHGIAFYHSSRAKFARGNPYGKCPRISLVGEIAKFDPNRAFESWDYPIDIRFERWAVQSIIAEPLVRSDATLDIFEGAGIVQGSVKTWYYAPPAVWSKILRHIRRNAR